MPMIVTEVLTRYLLLLVTSNGTGNGVVLSLDAIGSTLDVALRFGGLDLGLAGSVLLGISKRSV